VLRIAGRSLPAIEFGESDSARVGDVVLGSRVVVGMVAHGLDFT